MGRPATTLLRCQELHAVLLAQGVEPGQAIPKAKWDRIVVKGAQVGINQARNITETGHAAGLWVRIPRDGPFRGAVELLPATAPIARP